MATTLKQIIQKIERAFNETVPTVGTASDFEERVARDTFSGAATFVLAATGEITLIPSTLAAAKTTAANLSIVTTVDATANSRDYQLFYDDGAGGTPVALSSELVGTATAVTAAVRNPLTITAGVTIPAGSRVYLNSTHNGCGVASCVSATVTVEYL